MSRKTRQHRVSRAATDIPDDDIIILDEAPEPGKAEPRQKHTEIIPPEPEPEEEADDPLEVLRREVEEHKTAKAEAEKRYAEEKAERERLQVASTSHATDKLAQDMLVIEQAFTSAEARSKAAKRAFADAMNAGDFDAAAEAQSSIARVEGEMQRYADAYQVIEQRSKEPAPQPQTPQAKTLDAAIAEIRDPNTRQWATEHKADLADPKRLNLAYAADALAMARGLQPGSDEYLDFLDDQLGYEMTEPAPPPPPRAKTTARRAPPVAAPVSRGGGSKVSVTLTDTDKSFAQQLGLSPKDYARSLLAAKEDPRFNKYSNRLR